MCITTAALSGCGLDSAWNPSFPITPDAADKELRAMREERRPSLRPIVVVGGLFDPLSLAVGDLGNNLSPLLAPESAPLVIGLFGTLSTESSRRRVVEEVQRRWPSTDPARTIDVDVVGFSFGGLVARDAAIPRSGERFLSIARLFTLAAPHADCAAAHTPTLDGQVLAMRAGSGYLCSLDAAWINHPYPIIPYVRLGDHIVGPAHAAPPGEGVWWVSNPPFTLPHSHIKNDPRILADIARQLRGEPGYTTPPPAPLPD